MNYEIGEKFYFVNRVKMTLSECEVVDRTVDRLTFSVSPVSSDSQNSFTLPTMFKLSFGVLKENGFANHEDALDKLASYFYHRFKEKIANSSEDYQDFVMDSTRLKYDRLKVIQMIENGMERNPQFFI